ncbi:DNA-binding protein WhiA [Butyrivibrio sp. AE2032]|uniref:DNA-binding protein WhiA n=1 Tax=Butyrivibrio sp. AE2032 TaxID=1458463 RepID=UPI00054D43E8|nr:DNA-binding protein WhiA [Butyrivibrio sp. AE2032]
MEDSFSVRVKLETATKAVKKAVQRQTALCGLFLSQSSVKGSAKVIRIPERLSEVVIQLFEAENIECSYSNGRLKIKDIYSSELWERCEELLSGFANGSLSVEDARRFLRGAFWGCGYCSDPSDCYRIEFVVKEPENATLICAALDVLSIRYVRSQRKSSYAVYFKNGDDVSDFLGYIGSPSAMMDFENIRAEKDVNSKVVRTVNCDAGNTKRQAEAAALRNELIVRVMQSGMASKLSPELREAAKAHMENPGASLAELGAMMDPPIGKSGMRHRLDKIAEFAKSLQQNP